ncbi:MAG: DUF5687 family protein [Bacteroidales bacterium]|jgi:hypothetical protein|nr:DUF5687 family protein [Bacteroidales bacterium]
MNNSLISHQLKSARRSPIFGKSVGIKVLMGFLFFIILLDMLVFAFHFGGELAKHSSDPKQELLSYFLYYFGAMLLVRSMFQKLPTMAVTPYLLLPIKKSRLVNFILTKPFYNVFNLIPLVLILPIMASIYKSVSAADVFMILVVGLVSDMFVNYLAMYIKRVQIKHEFVYYIFLFTILSAFALEYFAIVDINALSGAMFMSILNNPVYIFVPVLLFAGIYYVNYLLLYNNFSLEEFSRGKDSKRGSLGGVTYFERFGKVGEFILLELKMMIRNKRTRTQLFMFPIFALYGLLFYTKPDIMDMNGFLIFVGLFMTGGFMMSFGLYFFAWESSHFDLVLTANSSYDNYIKSKYNLMVMMSVIMYLITIPYVYFGVQILLINTVTFLFNIGVNSVLLLYFATNNKKHMELSQGSAFNFQGVSGQHFVLMIPLLVFPVILYAPFGIAGFANIGFVAIGLLGVIGVIFRDSLLRGVTRKFIQRKHRMAEGFRMK